MRKPILLAAIPMLAMAGCDGLPFFQGNQADTQANAANASGNAAAADAGLTSSRSLAGLGGNSGGQGGKDPAAGAVQAGSQGAVDPRLVGRWTDTGDCKTVTELRPDGTFVATNGVTGRWMFSGDQLVFSRGSEEFRLRVDSIEPDRIVTTSAEGQTGPSSRC